MSEPSSEVFEESEVFQESLSKWTGLNSTLPYNDESELSHLDLHTAASIGETDVVRDILDEKRLKINLLNRGGWSALMYASYMGHSETIRCLLEIGADPNQRTPQGSTSLILAAMCGYDTVMEYLIQKGGDIEAKDHKGWTALFHAVSSGHQKTTDFLIKAGADLETTEPRQCLTPILEAAASGHEGIVLQLLHQCVDTTRTDSNGNDAQALACLYGHLDVAQLIEDYNCRGHDTHRQRMKRGTSNRPNPTRSYGSSGPSIHAGPREFAKMTGIGADGKPKLSTATPPYLQEPSQPLSRDQNIKSGWKGPKDLATLLDDIGCSRHLPVFKEQDIDLRIFLTLSEGDLKEIGIKLFGPRRKMVATIARLNNSISTSLSGKNELAYCDSLQLRLINMEDQLKELNEKIAEQSAQLAQERQLRSVAEGFLMEQEDLKPALLRCMDKLSLEHQNLLHTADAMRSFCMNPNQSKSRQSSQRHTPMSICGQEEVDEFCSAVQRSREAILEMKQVLRSLTSTALSTTHTQP